LQKANNFLLIEIRFWVVLNGYRYRKSNNQSILPHYSIC